jgi:hypothetical protein
MSIKSLMRIYCDKCNRNALNGGSGATFRGVLTLDFNAFARIDEHDTAEAHYRVDWKVVRFQILEHGWQIRGNDHWCPNCVSEEKDEADARNKAFRQSRGRRFKAAYDWWLSRRSSR